MSEFAVGIGAVLLGTAINNFGIVLQKRQVDVKRGLGLLAGPLPARRDESNPLSGDDGTQTKEPEGYIRDPIWLVGILMQTVLCLPFLLYAIEILGITLAQPLANAGVVFLVAGLVVVVKERLASREKIGVGIIVVAMICVGFGGVIGDISLDGFLRAKTLAKFWVFLGVTCALAIGAFALGTRVTKSRQMTMGLLAGTCYAIVSVMLQIFVLSLSDLERGEALLLFFLGLGGGVVATVVAISAAQEAFKCGKAVSVIPFTQVPMNLLPVIAGVFVFGQEITNLSLFLLGLGGIIVAATLLARFQQ